MDNQVQQLTEEQAKRFYESKVWESWTDRQVVEFQLFQKKLAIPFPRFHEAMGKVLKRPVYTTEFAFADLLRQEFLGDKEPPTLQEIMELIPKDKRVIIVDENGVSELVRERART